MASQDSLKRRFQDSTNTPKTLTVTDNTKTTTSTVTPFMSKTRKPSNSGGRFRGFGFGEDDDDLVSKVVPPVTVVLEGRSICQRISLDKHGSYQSLARALRQMFVDGGDSSKPDDLDLSNAVPGHLIAYEDMENDLLLAGDLCWKDFVRVAKRIRILPVKGRTRGNE
ncbi:PREDICTED: auxin-responsive protein IAA33-like [Tarenaya hassleriana]|uniref:auxin-responsive protein IAA33-like n=1 Tax=Tarenaya hassleriana TaxID=28532 RepID=UPI00053C2C1F|nr:PREDICTED: auxin-responsive protein IAA33-like [Tarenaya hassleriana]